MADATGARCSRARWGLPHEGGVRRRHHGRGRTGACGLPGKAKGECHQFRQRRQNASLRSMEQVAKAAYQCWFASKDKAFRA